MPKKGKPSGHRPKSPARRLKRKFRRTMNVQRLSNAERTELRFRHGHASVR